MSQVQENIKDRLDIPDGWKLEADWGKGEVPENIEYHQIGGRFSVTVANASQIIKEWEDVETGESVEVEESFLVTMGLQPSTGQYLSDLTQYVMIHAYPVATGEAEVIDGKELEVTFNHFISVADAMQSLMSLLEV